MVEIQADSASRAASRALRGEPFPDSLGELPRGLLGEGDRQDPVDVHPVIDHGRHEALDEHGRLPGAGPGAQQQRAVAPVDRAPLLGRRLGHASTRQIEGYEQPPR
jgi:hypothetical protein